ncbi:MAG: Npt1/Npt2 family nucleotide transporter [Candidatus Poribacteria bacterium]|nr:Npt1/Npt2 family nucleotide transporter [Candidatus Poribacteria bacterium]
MRLPSYIFREAYIVLIIEQYWSLVNSTLSSVQARRINGPFCGIASLGAIAGGLLVRQLAEPMGSESLLLFAAGSLFPAAVCSGFAYALAGEPKPSEEEAGGKKGHVGLALFLKSRYLVLIALLILTTQTVSTVLDLRFNVLVEMERVNPDERTAFYGSFYAALNTTALLLQFLAVPLILRFVSLRAAHVGIPAVHLLTCAILTVKPSLWSGAAAFLLFKALDYSIFRSGKEIFYIPLSYDERYRVKQIIDTFGYRTAKGGSAGVLALVGLFTKIPAAAFSIVAMVMAAIWSVLVSMVTKRYQDLENVKSVENTDDAVKVQEMNENG